MLAGNQFVVMFMGQDSTLRKVIDTCESTKERNHLVVTFVGKASQDSKF